MRLAVKFATASRRKSGRARKAVTKTVTNGEARTRGIYRERPPGMAGCVVSVLLGGAWLSLPTRSVLVEEAHESGAEDARCAGLAGAVVPDLQGAAGRPVPHAVGS